MNTTVGKHNWKIDWEIIECSFEERAAILEYEAGYTRYEAEQMAAQMQGYSNKAALKKHIQELKAGEVH